MTIDQETLKKIHRTGSREEIKRELVKVDASEHYRPPRYWSYELLVEELPIFNLFTMRLMLRDPVVQIGLTLRNAALANAEFEVRNCDDKVIQSFVQDHLTRLWQRWGRIIRRTKRAGFQGLFVKYKFIENGQIVPRDLFDPSPADTRVLTTKAKAIGFAIRPTGSRYAWAHGMAGRRVLAPNACWLTFDERHNNLYGDSILRRAYAPWFEKWMEGGCKKVTQLRMLKDAYIGDVLYYPENRVLQLPNGEQVSWQQVANEIVENRLSGATMAIPMSVDANGNPNVKYEPARDTGNPDGIFRWGDRLDKDILLAMSVPQEVIEAANTGSGFSGRSVPLTMFLVSCQEEFEEYLQKLDMYIIKPLLWLNFGRTADYDIVARSLLDTFAQEMSGSPMGGNAIGGMPSTVVPGESDSMAVQFAEKESDAPLSLADVDDLAGTALYQGKQWRMSLLDEIDSAVEERRDSWKSKSALAAAAQTFATVLSGLFIGSAITRILQDVLWGASVVGNADIVARSSTVSPQETSTVAAPEPVVTRPAPGPVPPTIPPADDLEAESAIPRLRFPIVERAVRTINERPAVAGMNYLDTAEKVRGGAFAITGDLANSTVQEIQGIIQKHINEGPDIDKFKEEVRGLTSLSDAHLETVFRANVFAYMSDAADAQVRLMPIQFPYRQYAHTEDDRVRPTHRAIGEGGLDGTGVYRADDPLWQEFRPPWDYNCRCTWNPVSVRQASNKGVGEARTWQKRAEKQAKTDGGMAAQYIAGTMPTTPAFALRPTYRGQAIHAPEAWQRVQFAEEQPGLFGGDEFKQVRHKKAKRMGGNRGGNEQQGMLWTGLDREEGQLDFLEEGIVGTEETHKQEPQHNWVEGQEHSHEDILKMVQASPQMGIAKDRDWNKYAEQWGVNEPFVSVELPTHELVSHNQSGRLHVSREVSQEDIDKKVESGQRNPIIIAKPKDHRSPLAVVDGTHSLHAAHAAKDKAVKAIVSQSTAEWLGIGKEQAKPEIEPRSEVSGRSKEHSPQGAPKVIEPAKKDGMLFGEAAPTPVFKVADDTLYVEFE